MCLAQGPQRSDAGEARTRYPSVSSQALYHWATGLPDDSREISCLICYFWESSKILNCHLLQIIGGALWVSFIRTCEFRSGDHWMNFWFSSLWSIVLNLISVNYRNLMCFNCWQLYILSKFNVSQCGCLLINHWPRASFPFIHGSRGLHCHLYMAAEGFIAIYTWQQRVSLPFIHGSRGFHCHLYMAAEGFIVIYTWQQRASLSFIHGSRGFHCHL